MDNTILYYVLSDGRWGMVISWPTGHDTLQYALLEAPFGDDAAFSGFCDSVDEALDTEEFFNDRPVRFWNEDHD